MPAPTGYSNSATLTDANATSVTDHVCVLELTSSNFTFSQAESDGVDFRFYDATADAILPHWRHSYDSVGETAKFYFRVIDITNTITLYWGNASATDKSNGYATFHFFQSFNYESDGVDPNKWVGLTQSPNDADDNTQVDSGQSVDTSNPDWVVHTKTMNTGAGGNANLACRVPHQRNCFYAAGREWVFYVKYTSSPGAPYDLCFDSTDDEGSTWAGETVLDDIPLADAQFDVHWDGTNVHIAKNIQTNAAPDPFHDGLEYRVGVPQSGGTISWTDTWQTVISTGNRVGDFSLNTDAGGNAWICYGDGDTQGGNGSCIVRRNANTDGTWSDDADFPVTVESFAGDDVFGIICPSSTSSNDMCVLTYRWDVEDQLKAYIVEDDGTVGTGTTVTANNVRASTGVGAKVARVDMIGFDGEIHLAYQSDAETLHYKWRNSSGSWQTEEDLFVPEGRNIWDEISPRVSHDTNGSIIVTWTDYGYFLTCMAIKRDGIWSFAEFQHSDFDSRFEHMMPATECNGTKLPMTFLNDSDAIIYQLVDTDPTAGSSKLHSMRIDKSTTNGTQEFRARIPTIGSGWRIELDAYVTSVSTGGDTNDNVSIHPVDSSDTVGPIPLWYGDGSKIGYFDGAHNKGSITWTASTWQTVGINLEASRKWTGDIDGTVFASSVDYFGLANDIDRVKVNSISTHSVDINIDALRVMPWVATEPDIQFSGGTTPHHPFGLMLSGPMRRAVT